MAKVAKKGRKVKSVDDLEKEIKAKCLSIKSVIESGNLKSLRELETLFSKAMADELGVNHGRFLDKLRNPIKFSMTELHRFSYYIDSDPQILTTQANIEVAKKPETVSKLKKFKSVRDLKQYASSSKGKKPVKKK